jgi:formylglycine-generating enzyme required for sulfatase activity
MRLAILTILFSTAIFVRAATVNELIQQGHYAEAIQQIQKEEGPNSPKIAKLRNWITNTAPHNLHKSDKDDVATNAESATAPLISQFTLAQNSSTRKTTAATSLSLSAEDRLELDTIELIARDAFQQSNGSQQRKQQLTEFLERSEIFLRRQPDIIKLWKWRANAAMELDLQQVATDACVNLCRLGILNSTSAEDRNLMATLNRKGWFKTPQQVAEERAAAQKEREEQEAALAEAGRREQERLQAEERKQKQEQMEYERIENLIPHAKRSIADLTIELLPVDGWNRNHGFLAGKTEVTQAQYQLLAGENPSEQRNDDFPVNGVTWQQAINFCDKLTQREQLAGRLSKDFAYRLPDLEQWKQLADFTAANEGLLRSAAWFAGEADYHKNVFGNYKFYGYINSSSELKLHAVALKTPNRRGFYDVFGNVWEWCSDPYSKSGNSFNNYHIACGGCYMSDASGCLKEEDYYQRSDAMALKYRIAEDGYMEHQTIGFRIVLVYVGD